MKHHTWTMPELASRSGKQLFFCRACGVLRPDPEQSNCSGNAMLMLGAYKPVVERADPGEPMALTADEIMRRLLSGAELAPPDQQVTISKR